MKEEEFKFRVKVIEDSVKGDELVEHFVKTLSGDKLKDLVREVRGFVRENLPEWIYDTYEEEIYKASERKMKEVL